MTKQPTLNIPGLAELDMERATLRKIARAIHGVPPQIALNSLGRTMYAVQQTLPQPAGRSAAESERSSPDAD